jgi:hypothetical protein
MAAGCKWCETSPPSWWTVRGSCRNNWPTNRLLGNAPQRGTDTQYIPQSRQSAKLFLQSSELVLPQPLTVCATPPPRFWGEGHTRWRERGWESPISDEGTYTVVLFIYRYFLG